MNNEVLLKKLETEETLNTIKAKKLYFSATPNATTQ